MPSSSSSYDNIHPGLSHGDALGILGQSLDELDSASDYYMAAAHLVNFPGRATEDALLRLIENPSTEQAVNLARRKAVEVLGRLGTERAISSIGSCLQNDDCYLVENAAWALLQLRCQVPELHQAMAQRLSEPSQSRRVLIQALAGLGVDAALPALRLLQDDGNPGVRGAALAGVAQLTGDGTRLQELEDHLTLPNQMDRQSAIQDLIDSRASSSLPSILRAPISPVFRLRALRSLWPQQETQHAGLDLLACLDDLIRDNPKELTLVHCYDKEPTTDFLFEELFGTDFSRCYLALATLKTKPPAELWPIFWKRWLEDAHNDYGAHYFFFLLIGSVDNWPVEASSTIQSLLIEAINSKRPQFAKSKPAACLALNRHYQAIWYDNLPKWLSSESTPNWELRYSAWMGIESVGGSKVIGKLLAEFPEIVALRDPDFYVDKKSQLLISE